MTEIFTGILALISTYRYPVAFLSSLLEGPITMVGGGMLVRIGQFDFFPLYLTLLFGDMVADALWYFVGQYAAKPFIKRFGKFFGVTQNVFEKMEGVFLKHDTKIIFISKVTMGFGFSIATLMAAGAMKVPFKKFIALNFAGGLVWTGFLITAGFFFGDMYLKIADSFKAIFVGSVIVTVIAVMYGFVYFVRKNYGRSTI